MTHIYFQTSSSGGPSAILPVPRVIKAGPKGDGVWESVLTCGQNTLLPVNPLNKPFLIKLDSLVFFFCLMAPLAFRGLSIYTSLLWNKDIVSFTNGKF